MKYVAHLVSFITNLAKWISFSTLIIMVPLVTYFSISRSLGYPVVGDIEIVQFSMVILIMGSLAYTEATGAHISISVLADRFPAKVQLALDFMAQFLTILFCFIVCWAFIVKINFGQTSDLLNLSFVPFKIFLVICFIGWALEAMVKFIRNVEDYKTAVKGK
ncbi:TRAP transporter small permease [Planococcus shenhongbingii]|uniref:TRAP transporter small permease n=1 Tax=Planococcus shenhongbingii TaxID=3058398 RepID=A0ABT8N9S0_9BACL|nr:TRAP transporter small permease [Planococcus sp. N017]MDN7244623.1 TRAP transporter small permease [Planococcus sp. N017]